MSKKTPENWGEWIEENPGRMNNFTHLYYDSFPSSGTCQQCGSKNITSSYAFWLDDRCIPCLRCDKGHLIAYTDKI